MANDQPREMCQRCQEIHENPCPRCLCVHQKVQDVLCPFCGARHTVYDLHGDQSCCRRTIDREHTCGRPTRPPSARTFCPSCQQAVTEALEWLPEAYVNLYLALEPGSGSKGERHSTGFESRVPLAESVSELMAEMVGSSGGSWSSPRGQEYRARPDPRGILTAMEDDLREHLGFAKRPVVRASTPEAAGQAGVTLFSCCKFLRTHLPALLDYRPDAGNELLALKARALKLLGRSRADDFEDLTEAACPWCGQRTLYREMGSDRVQCGSGQRCKELTLAEYRLLSLKELGWRAANETGRH